MNDDQPAFDQQPQASPEPDSAEPCPAEPPANQAAATEQPCIEPVDADADDAAELQQTVDAEAAPADEPVTDDESADALRVAAPEARAEILEPVPLT